MKRYILALAFFFSALTIPYSQVKQIRVQVAGLTCSMCSKSVHEKLKTISFTQSIDVDLEDNWFIITPKQGKELDFDVISAKVLDAGFSIYKILVTFLSDNITPVSDNHFKLNNKYYHFANGIKKADLSQKEFLLVDKSLINKKGYNTNKKLFADEQCFISRKAENSCGIAKAKKDIKMFHLVAVN